MAYLDELEGEEVEVDLAAATLFFADFCKKSAPAHCDVM